jgi:hypothetical protein
MFSVEIQMKNETQKQKFIPCYTDENLEGGHWLDNANPHWDPDAEYRNKPETDNNDPTTWLDGVGE